MDFDNARFGDGDYHALSLGINVGVMDAAVPIYSLFGPR
jgi:hypothetical protein